MNFFLILTIISSPVQSNPNLCKDKKNYIIPIIFQPRIKNFNQFYQTQTKKNRLKEEIQKLKESYKNFIKAFNRLRKIIKESKEIKKSLKRGKNKYHFLRRRR